MRKRTHAAPQLGVGSRGGGGTADAVFDWMRLAILPFVAFTLAWQPTGSMGAARTGHTATLLADGRVLVIGGGRAGEGRALSIPAELYDPASGTWSDASLVPAREYHTATALPDGRVLVAGGLNGDGDGPVADAQLYDAASGTWSTTASMSVARYGHVAVVLDNGRVLVLGGESTTAEVFDTATESWTRTGDLPESWTTGYADAVVALDDGRVLLVAGLSALYEPTAGQWTDAAPMKRPRGSAAVVRLLDGTVLVSGGSVFHAYPGYEEVLATSELYDPARDAWRDAAEMTRPRTGHSASVLPTGLVLVAGGGVCFPRNTPMDDSTELYDPVAGAWSAAASMTTRRASHSATVLLSGGVLVAGGLSDNCWTAIPSAEVFSSCADLDDDTDGDGSRCASDCDDADPARYPGAIEQCGGLVDTDCNGTAGDADGDGHAGCGGVDCDDDDPLRNPNAPEICDGVDNDCDGTTDHTDCADAGGNDDEWQPEDSSGCACGTTSPALVAALAGATSLAARRRRHGSRRG